MESKVLSGGAATAAAAARLRLPRRPRPECISFSFSFPGAASAHKSPTGDAAGAGNLIWGRQLRPSLVLETTRLPGLSAAAAAPVRRTGSPPPCSAAGGDSAGEAKVGFLDKNPALVTGFFFFMWYVSSSHWLLNPLPGALDRRHGCNDLFALFAVAADRLNLLKLLIPVAVCHALGHVTSNVSFAAVAVSFTHTVKALEPFFNAAASQFLLGQQIPLSLWLSLAPVVIGVSMASLTELSFNWTGFISAMISNISFTYRSLYSKKAMTDMDSTNVYAYISIIALIVCIPPAIIIEGPTLLKHGFNDAIAKVGLNKFVTDLFWVGLFYHLYNQLATNTLERVAPLTHAVGNVLKRVFVIGFSIVVFGNKISTQTGIGTAIAIAGVAIYSYLKAKMEEEKRVSLQLEYLGVVCISKKVRQVQTKGEQRKAVKGIMQDKK
ncbi:hypothetical protein Syun_008558 [Stephania yunnanensis]|uniref:Sugar phosphate transporter domain-containing protein n=1 Tax=Stephania yunnanensis TaxID=152371 RepID=A0AAP0PPR8_9MAGN